MAKTPADIKSLARSHTTLAINTLAGIARSKAKTSEGAYCVPATAKVAACVALLDRGWGKAAQPLTGRDGSEDITVTIRTIVEGKK